MNGVFTIYTNFLKFEENCTSVYKNYLLMNKQHFLDSLERIFRKNEMGLKKSD
jgi:hypothetical protein